MQKTTRTAFTALLFIILSVSRETLAQNIAVVNGTPIPASRARALIEELAHQGQQETPELRQAVNDELISREVLVQEAARTGIASLPDIKAQIALAQQSVMIRALLQQYAKDHQPSDAELRTYYDAIVTRTGNKEYHLHHILLDNEQQAKDLIAKLKRGANFESLAKQYSKDTGSSRHGGDLDWATPTAYVPPFSAAMIKLKKGQFTETPVHTQFGWHIIRLDDTRELKIPAFEDVKEQLSQQVIQQKLQSFQQRLRTQAKIQ